jgi:hypothetical protein
MMRNRAAFGVSSISEIQSWSPFFKVLVGPVEAARTGESTDQVESRLARETATLARADGVDPDTLNAFRLAPYWRRLTWRYIAADPLTYARLGARRAVLFFANIGTVGYAGVLHLRGGGTDVALWRNLPLSQLVREWVTRKTPGEKAIALWLSLWLLLSYVCLVVGLWVALRRGAGPFLMGCLFVAFYFIVAGASVGEGRFRTSAFLFYLPFVGIGAQWLWSRRPGAAPAAARSAGRQGRAAPDEAGSRRPDVP